MPGELRSRLPEPALVVGVFAVAGALAGVLWERFWTASVGVVIEGRLMLDGAGLRAEFDAVATYVLGAASLGLILGVTFTILCDRDEIATLAAVVVGSALAGWLMLSVGEALGPPDPVPLAAAAEDWTELPRDLTVPAVSLLAAPLGTVTGAIVVLLGLTRRSGRRHRREMKV